MSASPVVEQHSELEPLRDDWRALALEAGHPFATYEWAELWWRHFGGDRPLRILASREPDGRISALLPLYLWRRRPLRILRFLGHGPSDRLGPISSSENASGAASIFQRALDAPGWDVCLAEHVDRRLGLRERVNGIALGTAASPVLAFDDLDWERFLAGQSGNFRQSLRRRERRLAREHEFRITLSDGTRLAHDLETLFRLHDARWQGQTRFATTDRAFHEEFAAVALAEGWLRLWTLEVDGVAAAAWYGFRFGGWEWYYQAGRDPAFDRLSVGTVLLAHSIREAMNDGTLGYAFLRGNEAYKFRFAPADRPLETLGVARGVVGRAALRTLWLARAIKQRRETGASAD